MKFVYYLLVLISSGMLHAASARDAHLAECKEIEQQIDALFCAPADYRQQSTQEFTACVDAFVELAARYKALTGGYYFTPSELHSSKKSHHLNLATELAGARRHTHPTIGVDCAPADTRLRDERNKFLKDYFGLKEEQQ